MFRSLTQLIHSTQRQSTSADTLMFVPSIVFNERAAKDSVRRYVWDEQSERIEAVAETGLEAEGPETLRTLHVEDNAEVRSIVKYFLRKKRFHVDAAESGQDALQLAQEERYDVIIMDVNLGEGMDGIETTRRLRGLSNYKDVPIIAVTANLTTNIREHCLEAGMDAFLPKPFQKEDLLNTIRHVMEKRAAGTSL
jgi:CheY-like chemotaxis protein